MANPAVKNGFFPIANELAEQFARVNIPGQEWRILWVLLRCTWGWENKERRKDWDWISISQFEKKTGMKRSNVYNSLKSLLVKRLILKENNRLKFNQNYNEWVLVKRLTVLKAVKYKWPRECSICGFSGILERHHIIPKNEGGTKDYDNLIVLCPNHHSLADRGQISREDLRIIRQRISEKLGGIMQIKKTVSQKANGSVSQKTTYKRKKETNTKETRKDSFFIGLIDLLKTINPSISTMYGNTTQRKATDDLIGLYGEEEVLLGAQYAIEVFSKPYAPQITTPYELLNKWAKLISYKKNKH